MKKALFALYLIIPATTFGDTTINQWDVQYTWSYGALGDTMKEMRNNCEATSADEFLDMGNWFRQKGAKFTFRELVMQCVNQQHKFKQIDRNYKTNKGERKECKMPSATCANGKCGEKNYVNKYTNINGCNIFLSTLVKKTNERKKIRDSGLPGTYVKKVSNDLYKVVDVVLDNSYWTNKNTINADMNNSDVSTHIYEIKPDGTIADTGLHTWSNDMFMDIRASKNEKGDVGGVFTNSYIRTNVDLTKEVFALYIKRTNRRDNTIGNTVSSLQGGEFDIKATYAPKYKVAGQTVVESQSNGVIFNGRVVHLDWLGHILFGMNMQESVGPNVVAKWTAQGLSRVQGGNYEAYNMQNAWEAGAALVKNALTDTYFEDVQTRTKTEAFSKAEARMRSLYGAKGAIVCGGNCMDHGDDYVKCIAPNTRMVEFVFDDICDAKSFGDVIDNTKQNLQNVGDELLNYGNTAIRAAGEVLAPVGEALNEASDWVCDKAGKCVQKIKSWF